jgi:ribosomal protein S18 acetylase RimI-like enzyme
MDEKDAPGHGSAPRFRRANGFDADAITAVVNDAHAGGAPSWTHEADLFAGDRIERAEILDLLASKEVAFLVADVAGNIGGCVYLRKAPERLAYIGLLAVHPGLQGAGLGKRLVAQAEAFARNEWLCVATTMTVITRHRPELAAFYVGLGYVRTGRFQALERKGAVERAKVPGLQLEWLEKALDPSDQERRDHA